MDKHYVISVEEYDAMVEKINSLKEYKDAVEKTSGGMVTVSYIRDGVESYCLYTKEKAFTDLNDVVSKIAVELNELRKYSEASLFGVLILKIKSYFKQTKITWN